ncbi:sodium:solute symporter family protein [Roseiconus lacunae]|uniref:Sodium:solute symporter family protein n=1 Tax=Roseiconus lacunae TaxID=2605694 RepID=A0ABT7PHD6_9BACT|nr:sodium:solute symporter family protein [Roseiconus lacunae]MCD0458244.1 sodium:solute symporter family protein [Roseiconus lacunae]MDM4015656.1 sodium:solute symporter family protein [Roseiconus lacunae]WRQ52258.1 sodium:solute symporter family protein [Stieleria sp. HD01]
MESLNHPGLPQLIIIIIYLAILLILGLSSGRLFKGTKEDYQVASHSIGPFLLLMSIFGTTMTAFALVGSSGEAFKEGIGVYGMLASSSGIIHSLCFFLIGVKVWKFARRHKYTTQIEFFRDRLDSDFIGLLLFPILVGLVVPYLLIGVISAGSVVQSLTAGLAPDLFPALNPAGEPIMALHGGIPPWMGSLVICVVVLVYVFFGGMRGTTWANTLQTIVFMILGVVTFYVIANRLGGQDGLMANLQVLADSVPTEKLTRMEMSKTKFFTYLLIPLSVGMFPHLFQHWMTAKSANTFKVPVICHPLFIMIVWVPCVLVGVWATGDLIPPKPPLPNNPNTVLPFLVKTQTGKVLGGLLAAGILAAIMSSLDSQFLCLGTIFTNDILTHYKGKENVTDAQQVLYTRLFIIAIVAVTYGLGLLDPKSVFAMGVWCFSGFSALFPIVFAALYWRGLSAAGAIAGVLAAIASWGYMFYQALEQDALRTYVLKLPLGGEEYELMPVVAMLASSLITMVVVSLITPKPNEATLKKFFA